MPFVCLCVCVVQCAPVCTCVCVCVCVGVFVSCVGGSKNNQYFFLANSMQSWALAVIFSIYIMKNDIF